MTLFFIILLFAPTTTERPMFFPRRRVATYSYAYLLFFLHLRNDTERVRILYVLLSAKYSYTRRLRVRIIDSRLVRHVVALVYVWQAETYIYTHLHVRISSRRVPSCVRMDHCDIFVYSSSRTYFFTAPSSLCTYFPSRVLFL
jgi:hypothetical protein